ncbi:CehA/McbA family metallohydrolase [Tahibacter caeni]|uniref:CehA/McbA family metallohydrolase n=1 Tax=Tahibacter caeni TaxID=1453545 RepID=UPI0021496559|nr:CehA/McbA family metallohydrolase [Tahibacter caeni]
MSLPSARLVALGLLLAATGAAATVAHEHDELEASLDFPFRADADGARRGAVELLYPGRDGVAVAWQLRLFAADGRVLRRWSGEALAGDKRRRLELDWDGRDERGDRVADGIYRLEFAAGAGGAEELQTALAAQAAPPSLARTADIVHEDWSIAVGAPPRARLPADFRPLPSGATDLDVAVPSGDARYVIHYGNLHSQTNHSDGGGDLSTCNNAESPQSGAYGPADAFAYAQAHGLDFLLASEHNHMYDRSTGTNTNASQQFALDLYQSGLDAAATYTADHAGFLALYGMEWGVTTNGGHLNIIGAEALYGWEYNAANQLIGSFYTPKSDYASLYTFMRGQQVIGQFNHPTSSGQFVVDGDAVGYTADGDEVMVLSEVLNSSAFSIATDESETSRSSYESVWKKLLERGYHVAPASNQDNHCANWGASYGNRTAVLIPQGQALTAASLRDALRARRVFATMDKTAQILLTSGERLMGQRFANDGALNLRVDYASTRGRTASQVQIYEGVPGRNGTVTLAASSAQAVLNPAAGEHFYYAKITQDDGALLWSAPLWVTQLAPEDRIFGSGFY